LAVAIGAEHLRPRPRESRERLAVRMTEPVPDPGRDHHGSRRHRVEPPLRAAFFRAVVCGHQRFRRGTAPASSMRSSPARSRSPGTRRRSPPGSVSNTARDRSLMSSRESARDGCSAANRHPAVRTSFPRSRAGRRFPGHRDVDGAPDRGVSGGAERDPQLPTSRSRRIEAAPPRDRRARARAPAPPRGGNLADQERGDHAFPDVEPTPAASSRVDEETPSGIPHPPPPVPARRRGPRQTGPGWNEAAAPDACRPPRGRAPRSPIGVGASAARERRRASPSKSSAATRATRRRFDTNRRAGRFGGEFRRRRSRLHEPRATSAATGPIHGMSSATTAIARSRG